MAVITIDPDLEKSTAQSRGGLLPDYHRRSLEQFREAMSEMAQALGDLTTPMRRSFQNRERLSVEDAYACVWDKSKRQLGDGDEEMGKAILREQGCSTAFMSAIHNIITTDVGYGIRARDDQAQRFAVALRLAVHLSPDKGEAIYTQLDTTLHPGRSACSLTVVNAYLAFKAHVFGSRAA
jgi:hypothetical protein